MDERTKSGGTNQTAISLPNPIHHVSILFSKSQVGATTLPQKAPIAVASSSATTPTMTQPITATTPPTNNSTLASSSSTSSTSAAAAAMFANRQANTISAAPVSNNAIASTSTTATTTTSTLTFPKPQQPVPTTSTAASFLPKTSATTIPSLLSTAMPTMSTATKYCSCFFVCANHCILPKCVGLFRSARCRAHRP